MSKIVPNLVLKLTPKKEPTNSFSAKYLTKSTYFTLVL